MLLFSFVFEQAVPQPAAEYDDFGANGSTFSIRMRSYLVICPLDDLGRLEAILADIPASHIARQGSRSSADPGGGWCKGTRVQVHGHDS